MMMMMVVMICPLIFPLPLGRLPLQALVASTLDPFPAMPSAPDEVESEMLDSSWCPEGLTGDWWDKLVNYRGQKV